MAKRRRRIKVLQEEEKLIEMSADNAKGLANNFKGVSEALKTVIENLEKVADKTDKSAEKTNYFTEGLKNGKNLVEGLQKGLGKMADKLDKSGTLSNLLKGNFKDVFKLSNLASLGTSAMVGTLIKGAISLDKLQTQYQKTFGLTNQEAAKLQKRFEQIAHDGNKNRINFNDIHKAVQGIAESSGIFAGNMRDDVLYGAAEAQKLIGLSNEGMARLAFNAQTTGKSYQQQEQELVKGVVATEKQLGVILNVNKAYKLASQVTGMIRANLGRSYEEIARVSSKAMAFGLTMQDLANISSNMLDFQSSIEAELTAELFLGKQLYLEKARLYALTGDYEGLLGEIQANLGTQLEFLTMNVLQKQKFAAALGMSVDQLSNLIMAEADLDALRQDAEARGETEIAEMIKKRTLQEEFNDLIVQVQTSLISMANNPAFQRTLGFIKDMVTNARALKMILVGILGLKLISLVSTFVKLAAAIRGVAIMSGVAKGLMMGLAGLAMIAVAAALITGISGVLGAGGGGGGSGEGDTSDTVQYKTKSFAGLGDEEMVTIEKGGAMFHAGETVVREDNFGKLHNTMGELLEVTKEKQFAFTVETHHATRYR